MLCVLISWSLRYRRSLSLTNLLECCDSIRSSLRLRQYFYSLKPIFQLGSCCQVPKAGYQFTLTLSLGSCRFPSHLAFQVIVFVLQRTFSLSRPSSTFTVAYGFSKSDPLTYKLCSHIALKSSSDFNLYSWRFPLTKLCPLFPKKMFDLVFSQHFIDFDLSKSLAIKRTSLLTKLVSPAIVLAFLELPLWS